MFINNLMIRYISLGCNCSPMLALTGLNLKQETLPFDWSPSTLKIIIECINNDFENFAKFDTTPKIVKNFNDELARFQTIYCPNFDKKYINYYNVWFPHHVDMNEHEFSEMINRRIVRMINVLENKDGLIFIYSNEHAIYIKEYRERQREYYNDLIRFQQIMKNKYKKKYFIILAYFINETFPNIDNLYCYNINVDVKKISDNCETHNDNGFDLYRKTLQTKLRQILCE